MKLFYTSIALLTLITSCSSPNETEESSEATEKEQVITQEEATLEINDFHHYYTGKIDGQYEVEMFIHANGTGVKGYYVYIDYGIQIQLEGTIDKEARSIHLEEFGDPNSSESTGTFNGSFDNNYGISGSWTDPEEEKNLNFKLQKERELFTWFTIDVPFHPCHVSNTLSYEGDSYDVDITEKEIEGIEYMEGEVTRIEMYGDSTGYVIDFGEDMYMMRDAFFEYSVLAQEGETFIVETYECGGGTGIFSNIRVLTVKGKTIELMDSFGGGDRCNGGLNLTSYDRGVVSYSSNITPDDLLQIGVGENAADYDISLDWCAMCCIGTANYEYDLSAQSLELVSISLETEFYGYFEDDSDGTECFLGSLNDRFDENSYDIPLAEFKKAVEQVLASCMIPVG